MGLATHQHPRSGVLGTGSPVVIVGILVSGRLTVRAAEALAAQEEVDEVVVVSPATSSVFRVVQDAEECDLLVGSGPDAPGLASSLGCPLVWDGDHAAEGVAVYGASPQGLALAVAARESDPQLVAVAHPGNPGGSHQRVRFPDPIGRRGVFDGVYADRRVATAASPNPFSAVLTNGVARRVTIVDDADFLTAVALAAGVAAIGEESRPVWDAALAYLRMAVSMGLVMAEA